MSTATLLKKLSMAAAGAALIALGAGGAAQAATIFADTTGTDNNEDPSFYGVSFLEGSLNSFIQSISYNLSVDPDAFFDFDGDSNFVDATAPVIDLSSLVGLTASDISFSFANPVGGDPDHPSLLTINFAPSSFGVGDSFRFAADTDFLVSAPAPGSVFGIAGVPFSVTLENGTSGSTTFAQVSSTRSEATVFIDDTPTDVPEPASVLGLLAVSACGVGSTLKRKQKQKVSANRLN